MDTKTEKTELLALAIFFPSVAALAIIPIFTKVTLYATSVLETMNYYGGTYDPNTNMCYLVDINTVGKASLICGFAIAMLVAVVLCCLYLFKNCEKRQLAYTGASVVYVVLSLISALGSDYSEIALSGAFGHMEGFYVTASYFVMFLFTMYAFKKTQNFKFVVAALIICTTVNFVIGCFQLAGNNLLLHDWYRSLVTDNKYENMIQLNIIEENRQMYGALYNYNYVGSFMGMIVPMFSVLAVGAQRVWHKLVMAFFTAISLFMLLASTARSGIIAVAVAAVVAVFVFARVLIRRWKITVSVAAAAAVLVVGANAAMDNALLQRIPLLISDIAEFVAPAQEGSDLLSDLPVQEIQHNIDGTITLVTVTDELNISFDAEKKQHIFTDLSGEAVTLVSAESGYSALADEDFKGLLFKFERSDSALEYNDRLRVRFEGGDMNNVNHSLVFALFNKSTLHAINIATGAPITPVNAESMGFEGKESVGSARGYIWSRTLPLLKNCIVTGYGPDTYAYEFPQNDCLAKYSCYLEGFYITVDKPHDLYMQIWFSNGLIALIAFLAICVVYLVDCFRLYALKPRYRIEQIYGVSVMLAVVGYLAAGVFNDSVVPVAPVFWILLGVGAALNAINRRIDKEHTEQTAKPISDVTQKSGEERKLEREREEQASALAARIRAKLDAQENGDKAE